MIKRYDELRICYAQLHMLLYPNTYRRVGAKPHPNKMKS